VSDRYPPGHEPDGDGWVCSCGYDFFGGTAAYSWQLYEAHTAAHGYVWSDR
jgi:hypothetical protein